MCWFRLARTRNGNPPEMLLYPASTQFKAQFHLWLVELPQSLTIHHLRATLRLPLIGLRRKW